MAIETHRNADRLQRADGAGRRSAGPAGSCGPGTCVPAPTSACSSRWSATSSATCSATSWPATTPQNELSDQNDIPIVLGYAFGTLGWLGGLGVFNDLGRQMLGRPLLAEVRRGGGEAGVSKYFRYTLDHKVVGIQYLYGMIAYFLTGGLFAMAIRTELLSPSCHAARTRAST